MFAFWNNTAHTRGRSKRSQAMDRGANTKKPSKPRLVLVTPPVEDSGPFARELGIACSNADIAAVILRLAPADDATQIKRIRDVVVAMPDKGPAVMLDGYAHLLNKTAADGVHLPGDRIEALAPEILREDRMVGAGALASRHDAMIAGEIGAYYVLFGEPDAAGRRPGLAAVIERIDWWSKLFVIPCIAYAGSLDEMDDLAQAGADFIALGEESIWSAQEGPVRALAAAMVHLAVTEPTG